MPKLYIVKARRCVEETYCVKADSRQDAIGKYADAIMVGRTDDHDELETVSVKPKDGTLYRAYSVLLEYPLPKANGDPETFYAQVLATTVIDAVGEARKMAQAANTDGDLLGEDFYPLLVLAGHVEPAAFGGEVQ